MHDDRLQTEDRLNRALDSRLVPLIHTPIQLDLEITAWHAPGEPVSFDEAVKQTYVPFAVGEQWGRAWGTTWFHLTGTVPSAPKSKKASSAKAGERVLELVVDLGFEGALPGFTCEGLVYTPDGVPLKGIHPRNRYVRLGPDQTTIDLFIEAAANPDLGMAMNGKWLATPAGDWDTAGEQPVYTLRQVEVCEFDADAFALVRDLEVAGQLIHELDPSDARRWQLTTAIASTLDVLDAAPELGDAIADARATLAPVLKVPARPSAHQISAVGHAHIDSAWLWPLRETVRKVARTVSNVTALAEDYPELIFAFSSAQQHAWIKEHHPVVWKRLKKAVADGVIVPVGGMWVESDTNMVGAEAMCRQFVAGKRFFLDEYGIETTEVWLPDSFGYAAGLPQIVAQSASTYFLTQKISWNRVNKFPHHTFWWEGIDGTRIFTHFPPADTYNSDIHARELAHAARNYADKAYGQRSLLPFGFGDGGGGPTREQVERARRVKDLEGSPKLTIERPDAFFAAAHEELAEHAQPWSGELYLEIHRGTYTSQARTKQGNRRSESLLREAELWAATAAITESAEYPYDDLDRLWKRVLLHQFHDILPGSSIRWVHREAEAAYAEIATELEKIIQTSLKALAGEGKTELTFNAGVAERNAVPAMGAGPARDRGKVKVTRSGKNWTLSNGLITAVIDPRGALTSVLDHTADDEEFDREVLAGPSNVLQIHPDYPVRWDAWDVDSYYRNSVTDISAVESITAIDGGVAISRKYGDSTFAQTITLAPGADRVDFSLEVDWHEHDRFLKAGFCLDLAAERSAAETQFGHVWRPTHQNTSWDVARFEICAHRYLHLAEADYGVTLVNDSTYGHDVRRVETEAGLATEARLSLLRAPRYPDPQADQGKHVLRYALVVSSDLTAAVQQGYAINLPERRASGSAAEVTPLVSSDHPEIVIATVKLADDRSGDLVIRAYQATGARSRGRIELGFSAKSVKVVDLLERPIGATGAAASPIKPNGSPRVNVPEVALKRGVVELELRPFQLVTLRFQR